MAYQLKEVVTMLGEVPCWPAAIALLVISTLLGLTAAKSHHIPANTLLGDAFKVVVMMLAARADTIL